MKLPQFIVLFALIFFFSCGKKQFTTVTEAPANSNCNDTFGTLLFTNTQNVELRIAISSKTSVKEGNTIINTWKNGETLTLKPGDVATRIFRSDIEQMYTVYGPVSTNVNGLGIIAEEKFKLKACEMRNVNL